MRKTALKPNTENVDINSFILDLLGIESDFVVSNVEKNEQEKQIIIHLEYKYPHYQKNGEKYSFYDKAPKRIWQHLNWFEYKCLIMCSLPRYLKDDKVITVDVDFAPKKKHYTLAFAKSIVGALQEIKVQRTVAKLFSTSEYTVRSIMEIYVKTALKERGNVTDFENVSLDEKAYTKGHNYASILIDTDKEKVLNLVEGRKEEDVKELFFELNKKNFNLK